MADELDEWQSLVETCVAQAQPATAPKPIENIAIVTSDRTAGLIRAAKSYLDNAKKFGRKVNLVVADDSKTAAARAQSKSALLEISKGYDVPVFYAGLEEKQAYADHLAAQSGVARELIDFALFDPLNVKFSPGANRNALLLNHAGETFFCADDDTVCELVNTSDGNDSVYLSQPFNMTNIWPYESIEEIEKTVRFEDVDFLAAHEKTLGKDIGTILKDAAEIGTDELSPGFLQSIEENKSRVLVSCMGLAGDCGYRTPIYLIDLVGPAFDHLTKLPEGYRKFAESRQILRSSTEVMVTKGGFCQSIALAFDARQLLPPFLPVLRGEDWTFSMLLSQTNPAAAMAQVPLSIMHRPLDPRMHTSEEFAMAPYRRPVVPLFVGVLRNVQTSSYLGGPMTLDQLGKVFKHFVADKNFEVFAEQNAQMESAAQADRMIELLETRPDTPEYWKKDVQLLLQAQEKAAQEESYNPPEELIKAHGKENAFPVLQKILVQYGDLMMAWPKLFEAARVLRHEKNITLAQKI